MTNKVKVVFVKFDIFVCALIFLCSLFPFTTIDYDIICLKGGKENCMDSIIKTKCYTDWYKILILETTQCSAL